MMIEIDGPRSKLPKGWSYGAHWSDQPRGQSGWWLLHESGASVRGKDVGNCATDERVADALAAFLAAPDAEDQSPPRGRPGARGAASWPKVTIRLDPAIHRKLQIIAGSAVSGYVAQVVTEYVESYEHPKG